jgi:hypothetical protein
MYSIVYTFICYKVFLEFSSFEVYGTYMSQIATAFTEISEMEVIKKYD